MSKASLFITDLEALTINDVEDFCCINSPFNQRVKKGHVDYKKELPNDLGKTISAMANISGGLIILGVEEDQGTPTSIVGMPIGSGDIKKSVEAHSDSTLMRNGGND